MKSLTHPQEDGLHSKHDIPETATSSFAKQIGINMVDLMMWLVIAALLLAAALQGIGYYQKASYVYQMQNDVRNAVTAVTAEASLSKGVIDDDVMEAGIANAAKTQGVTLEWGTISAAVASNITASGNNEAPLFELASAVSTAVPAALSTEQYVIVASHEGNPDTNIYYYLDHPSGHDEGMTTSPAGSVPVAIESGSETTTPPATGGETGGTGGTTTAAPLPESTGGVPAEYLYISDGGKLEGKTPDQTKTFVQYWGVNTDLEWLMGQQIRSSWTSMTDYSTVYQSYTITRDNIRIIATHPDGKIKEFVIEVAPPAGNVNFQYSSSNKTEIYDVERGIWRAFTYAAGAMPPPYPYAAPNTGGGTMPPPGSMPPPGGSTGEWAM